MLMTVIVNVRGFRDRWRGTVRDTVCHRRCAFGSRRSADRATRRSERQPRGKVVVHTVRVRRISAFCQRKRERRGHSLRKLPVGRVGERQRGETGCGRSVPIGRPTRVARAVARADLEFVARTRTQSGERIACAGDAVGLRPVPRSVVPVSVSRVVVRRAGYGSPAERDGAVRDSRDRRPPGSGGRRLRSPLPLRAFRISHSRRCGGGVFLRSSDGGDDREVTGRIGSGCGVGDCAWEPS